MYAYVLPGRKPVTDKPASPLVPCAAEAPSIPDPPLKLRPHAQRGRHSANREAKAWHLYLLIVNVRDKHEAVEDVQPHSVPVSCETQKH